MTVLTANDAAFGGLMVGIGLTVLGILVIGFCRSAYDERLAKKAERIVSSPAPFEMTEQQRAAVAEHMQQRISTLYMSHWADRLADPETVLLAFPEQRKPVDDVFDVEERGL